MADLRVSFPKPCDEKWEEMSPAGCDRVCARCDKVIHDLSNYEFEEAEAILRGDDACVRAEVGADGVIALKPGRQGALRRMVIAVGASAGLLAASAPALAKEKRPEGAVEGGFKPWDSVVRVTATSADGKTYTTKPKRDGRYRLKHLPPGTYSLTFVPSCGDTWTVENVVVKNGEISAPSTPQPDQCIIVGLLTIEDGNGSL